MITVSYNAYCAISKEGDNDIWTVRPRGVVPLLPLCSQIDVGAIVNALLGDTFSRENNTHGSRFRDRDPQFASRILRAMTQSCYIGTRDIRSRVIRGPYCSYQILYMKRQPCNSKYDISLQLLHLTPLHAELFIININHYLHFPTFTVRVIDELVENKHQGLGDQDSKLWSPSFSISIFLEWTFFLEYSICIQEVLTLTCTIDRVPSW